MRENGAVPATIAIIGGKLTVGCSKEEIERLGKGGLNVPKVSRRDIPFVVAKGQDGATTVAATMYIAHLAGIDVFATGGIGGVHRKAETTMIYPQTLTSFNKQALWLYAQAQNQFSTSV